MIKIKNLNIWFVFLCGIILHLSGCKNKSQPKDLEINESKYVESDTELKYKTLKKGIGESAENGDEVFIFETTSYRNGTKLYSNEKIINSIKIKLGASMIT